MTLYQKTAEFILRMIEDEGLEPGSKLPTEAELAKRAGVSIITIRRAVFELVQAGILVRQQGRGTFVAEHKILTLPNQPGSLRETLLADDRSRHTIATQLLQMTQLPSPPETARELQIRAGLSVWSIKRLRSIDGVPSVLDYSTIPVILAPTLTPDDLTSDASLYELLERKFNLVEAYEDQEIEAVTPSEEQRKLLKTPPTVPLLVVRGVSYATNGMPFDRFKLFYDSRRFVFYSRSSPQRPTMPMIKAAGATTS